MSSKNKPLENNAGNRSNSRTTTIICALLCAGSVLLAGFSFAVRGGAAKQLARIQKEWKKTTAERDRMQGLIRESKRKLEAQKSLLERSNSQTSQ